jgi:3-oxoacyl-[acyl-carrier-protein] synthase I
LIKAAAAQPIAVVAAGAVTCVGLTWESSCAAMRASLDGFAETHFVDDIGEPLLGAAVPDDALGLQDHTEGAILGGAPKLAAMFVRAATECVRAAGGIQAAKTALLLVGPENTRPGFSLDRLQQCFQACEQAVGRRFHESSQITQIGSPGLAAALQYAQQLLQGEAVSAVLVAGVDSLLNVDDVNDALRGGRILSSNHSDGFIPGEAAACLLLRRQADLAAQDDQGQPRGAVLLLRGTGLAQEPNSWASGKPNHGKGLAQALKAALAQAGLQAHEVHHKLSNAAGESFFMDEDTYAWSRVLRALSPPGFSEPLTAASTGQCGAAQGVLAAALALDMAQKGWASGANFLIHLANPDSVRGAVVLQAA